MPCLQSILVLIQVEISAVLGRIRSEYPFHIFIVLISSADHWVSFVTLYHLYIEGFQPYETRRSIFVTVSLYMKITSRIALQSFR
jgi:hypothetical protein